MRHRPRRGGGKLLPVLCTLSCLPLFYMLASMSLPYVSPALSRAAILSAELNLFCPGEGQGAAAGEASGQSSADTTSSSLPLASGVPESDVPSSSSAEAELPTSSLQAESPELSASTGEAVIEEPQASSEIPNAAGEITDLQPVIAPAKPAGAGTLIRKTYTPGSGTAFIPTGAATVKNCTSISADAVRKTIAQQPKLTLPADGQPMVLIMHTHATESYQEFSVDWYDKSYTSRTTDLQKNMCRVGDEIQEQLEAAGIGVIHDETLHDYPSYNGAYERSAVTVKKYLEQYPSIQVVLDVHRDAIQPDSSTMVAPVADIDGKSCAQVMIISGCDDGTMNMPNYMENLKLSAALARSMEDRYPGLSRPILFDYRKYNQDLTTGSILLEVGGHANTLEEAVYAGELTGKCLADLLLSLK